MYNLIIRSLSEEIVNKTFNENILTCDILNNILLKYKNDYYILIDEESNCIYNNYIYILNQKYKSIILILKE